MTITARNCGITVGDWIEGECVTLGTTLVGLVVAVSAEPSGPDATIRDADGKPRPIHYSRHSHARFALGDRVILRGAPENSGIVTHAARVPGGAENVEVEFADGSGYHGDGGALDHKVLELW